MGIDLTKRAEIVNKIILEKDIDIKANVELLVDKSGSMRQRFASGVMQDLCERVLAVGMNMDVDKSIKVLAFNTFGEDVGTATADNYKGFMQQIRSNGGTSFAPVMQMAYKDYYTTKEVDVAKKRGFMDKLLGKHPSEKQTQSTLVKSELSKTVPILAVVVTDGDNGDRTTTEHIIRETSNLPIFWQFIGIQTFGTTFEFLKKLDKLSGRVIDNANFFEVQEDFENMSDDQLYRQMLNEFPKWVRAAKAKGILE